MRSRTIRYMAGQPVVALPRQVGWLVLGALTALIGIGLARHLPEDVGLAVSAAVIAVGAAALMIRARFVLGYAAVVTAGVAVLGNGTSSNIGWFAVCVVGGWCVLRGGWRVGVVYWAATLLLFAAEWVWVDSDEGWGTWMAGLTFTILATLLVRHDRNLVAQLRAAQAGLAERTRAEERNRIARELHDVIAHSLTISLLHVTSARLAVEYDPADAARSLAEAERLGRQSLDEVRATVGMLRPEAARGLLAPLPSVDGLPDLVERFRQAGAEVTLAVDGDPSRLPATTGLAVYRIAQEALTNAVKHAPGASIAVGLAVAATAADLTVESSGVPREGSGLGLVSMRERAESLGGSCTAGPGGHGWIVRATLPLRAERVPDGAR